MPRRFLTTAAFVAILLSLPTGAQEKIGNVEIVARLKGHADAVYAVAYSPDGKFIATASFDNTIKLWDAVTGKEIKTYGGTTGHTKQVIAVAFSQDGSMLASGSTDNTLKVWDVPINAPIRSLKTNDAVQTVALSPDGLKLAIGGKDGSLKLVTPAEFKELVKLEGGHQGAITGLSFNSTGTQFASVGVDRTLRYWNVADGKLLAVIGAHTRGVNGVVVNPNNTGAYTIGDDGFLKTWQFPLPPLPKTLPGHGAPIRALAMSSDNATYYTGSDDRTVRQFAIAGGKEVRGLAGPQSGITCVATHPANTFVAAGTSDNRVFLWNNADPKTPLNWLAHGGPVTSMQIVAPGQQLMTAGADGFIKFWAIPSQPTRTLTHPDVVLAAASSPDGKKLVTGSADKIVRLWDTSKQAMEKQFAGHTGPVTAVAVSANLAVLASGGADNTIRIWNPATAKEAEVLPAHAGPVTALAINPAGNQLLSASEDGTLKLWALPIVAKKGPIWEKKLPGPVRRAIFTPKGDQIISAGDDKAIKIWMAADGKEFKSFTNEAAILQLSVSADATKIATAGADKNIRIWTVADGKTTATIPAPNGIQGLSLSPNGQRLAIALQDGAKHVVRIHDVALGKDLQIFEEHAAPLTSVQFLGDGRTLVTASADKTAKVLDVNLVSAFAAHPAGPTFAQYNANGTQLITAGADKIAKLWDVQKAALIKPFGPVPDAIKAVAFSKDFTKVGVAAGKTVKVWNGADGKDVATLNHAVDVLSFSFNQDGTRIATGCADKQTRLFDVASGKELQFFAQEDNVDAVIHLPNNVIISAAGKVTRIDTSSIVRQAVADAGPTRALTIVPANTHVFTGGADKVAKLWNLATGAKEREIPGATGPIKSIAISKNALLLAIGGTDLTLRLHQFADGKEIGAVKLAGESQALAFTPNSAAVVASTVGKTLNAWSTPFTAGQPIPKDFLTPIQSFTTSDLLSEFVIAGDNASIYSAGQDKALHVWKLASPNPTRNFPHGNNVDAVAFAPVAKAPGSPVMLLSAGHDGKIRLFDLVKNAQVKDVNAHLREVNKNQVPQPIYSLVYSPDGTKLLTSSYDNSLKLWDMPAGTLVKEFKAHKEKEFEKGHQEPVYAAAFSPDGKFIASGSSGLERVIKIWSLDGNVVRDLSNPNFKSSPGFPAPSHPGAVTNLRFTKDGKHLISVGDAPGNKGFLAVWDWQAGKMLSSETLQLGVFYGLALAPDEKTLTVTAGNRDRKGASPEYNAAYILKLPPLK